MKGKGIGEGRWKQDLVKWEKWVEGYKVVRGQVLMKQGENRCEEKIG